MAGLTGQKPEYVQLTLSGMAAIFQAFRLCQRARPGRKV